MFELPDKIRRKPTSDAAAVEARRAFWVAVFADAPAPNDELIVLTAWRLTRRIALWKGIVKAGETLRQGTGVSPSPWKSPIRCFAGAPQVNESFALELRQREVPLLPPEIRADLPLWQNSFLAVGLALKMHQDPQTLNALKCLTGAPHDYWPSAETLMDFEEALAEDTFEVILKKGMVKASKTLQKKYQLTFGESMELVKMTQELALPANLGSIETARAWQLLRLEDLILRCRLDGDFRAELAAIKVQNKLLGLNKPVAKPRDSSVREELEKVITMDDDSFVLEDDEEKDAEEGQTGQAGG